MFHSLINRMPVEVAGIYVFWRFDSGFLDRGCSGMAVVDPGVNIPTRRGRLTCFSKTGLVFCGVG